ncbi:hypothetical protein [Lentibacillus halodurans]|uniref:hypothetical protein n=1 Tax=Lentibacillus halodurans TaxID=237679 RepID=UPI001479C637|nr:hypothetical protein [Lentibacillus halodurans]
MNYERGGIAFTGCFFLGIGMGMWAGDTAAGTMIGMGVGFLAMALFGKCGSE